MDNDMSEMQQSQLDRRFSVYDRVMFGHRPSYNDLNYRWGSSDNENESPIAAHYSPVGYSGTFPVEDTHGQRGKSSHLTSGQKEGDELRRNSDVMEILRKIRFPRVHGMGNKNFPQTIFEHE
ncbi:hypothetical protein Ancab_022286 [Ancistrocladus abbreviatus]